MYRLCRLLLKCKELKMAEIEKAKKIAELTRKLDSAENKVKQYLGYLESDIKCGRDTTYSRSDYNDAVRQSNAIKRELDRLS